MWNHCNVTLSFIGVNRKRRDLSSVIMREKRQAECKNTITEKDCEVLVQISKFEDKPAICGVPFMLEGCCGYCRDLFVALPTGK